MPDITTEPSDRLAAARGALADIAHQDDTVTRAACQSIIEHSDSASERAKARDLLHLIDGEGQSA